MKKVTTVCLSTFILGSLGMTSQAFAEDGGSYTSNGIVEFTPSEDPTNPVDPTDPTNPVDPIDPTDPATQKYKTVGATDEVKEGPNYVQVTDNRGTEAGWSLKVKQEGQFKSTSGKELTGAAITFKNGNVVTASDSGKPTGPATITLNSDGSQSDVMSAAKGNGAGTYLFDWGTDATTAAKSIELTVPGSTTKYAEKYATKLTWTLTDAPGN